MKLLTGLVASLALLFVVATPASASCTITVNGVEYDCSQPVEIKKEVKVSQSNCLSVVNNVVATANTGSNASGSGTIITGDAKVDVKMVNKVFKRSFRPL